MPSPILRYFLFISCQFIQAHWLCKCRCLHPILFKNPYIFAMLYTAYHCLSLESILGNSGHKLGYTLDRIAVRHNEIHTRSAIRVPRENPRDMGRTYKLQTHSRSGNQTNPKSVWQNSNHKVTVPPCAKIAFV